MDGSKKIMVTSGEYTPLKISIRTADETSTKLPVTHLNGAPLMGAVSNLHWYKFQIIDNTLFSRDKTEIYSRNFKIGGTYPDCVNISIIYENNKPVDATMPILLSDPECSFDRPLEKGGGAIIMIKTLLNYVYTQLPTLTHIKFDDKSNIECATEEELHLCTFKTPTKWAVMSERGDADCAFEMHNGVKKGSRFRKKGTYVKPIPLYYFSILFNGETWYEKHFNAKQKDEVRHQQYRKKVTEFLYSPEFKTNMSFDRFVSLFDKREEEMTELYEYYNNANNFNDFFQSIPKQHRCRLVGSWIEQFMKFILKDVFYNENWIIHFPLETTGGNTKIRNKNNKTKKYYCPKGIIRNNFQSQNICITPEDI